EDELYVLWEELNKLGTLYLFEVLWFDRSPFKWENGGQQYPQLIKKIQVAEQPNVKLPNKNPQNHLNQEWVYLQIAMAEQQVSSFLRKCLPTLIREIPQDFMLVKWF